MTDVATLAQGNLSFQAGDATWKQLRRKARNDLWFFNAVVLGHADIVPMRPYTHLPLIRFAERKTGIPEIDEARVQIIEMPRGSGKSTLVTKGRSIQRLIQNPDYALGIANETTRLAKAFLSNIKAEFEQNELLRRLFPDIAPADFRDRTWAADQIVLNRSRHRQEPSVLAAGVDATVTGVHMDEWLLDDIISREAAENARSGSYTQIEKINRWLVQLEPLLTTPKRDPITIIGCIAQDEPVLMADGSYKPIQEISVGDEVWARKKSGGEFAARKVTGFWPQGRADVIEAFVGVGKVICTSDHPIRNPHGKSLEWIPAEDLDTGAVDERCPVYDLTIEDGECSFIVGDVEVANTRWWENDCYSYARELWGYNEEPREYLWRIKLPDGQSVHLTLVRQGDIAIFSRSAIENGRSIFPERYTLEELAQKQTEDPVFFAANYLNDPTADVARDFKDDWLRYYYNDTPYQIRYQNDYGEISYLQRAEFDCVMAVDPAISESARADRTGIIVSGTADGRQHFILEAIAERGGVMDICALVEGLAATYNPRRIFVEKVAYQEALAQILGFKNLPVVPIHPGSKRTKEMRIRALEPFFRRRRVFVTPAQVDLIREYRSFPRGRHDDLLDAMAYLTDEWGRMGGDAGSLGAEARAAADAAAISKIKKWADGRR